MSYTWINKVNVNRPYDYYNKFINMFNAKQEAVYDECCLLAVTSLTIVDDVTLLHDYSSVVIVKQVYSTLVWVGNHMCVWSTRWFLRVGVENVS